MLRPIQDKFGKAFVPKYGTGGKEYRVLEGANFSNLNLQVMSEGSKDEMFKGKRFHVGVLGVRLKIPFPLGTNIKPDMEKIQPALMKEIEIGKKFKFIRENDKEDLLERKLEMIRNCGWSLYYAITVPGYDWIEHEFPFVAGLFSEMDDLLESFGNGDGRDNECKGNKRQKCKYKLVSQVANILSELIQPHSTETFRKLMEDPFQLLEMACDGNSALKPTLAKYKLYQLDDLSGILELLLLYVSTLRSSAISTGLKKGCSAEGFLYQTGLLMKACALEWSREWNSQIMSVENAKLMLPTMVALRQTSVAGNYSLESAFLVQGISLPNKLRDTALFKLVYDKCCSNTQKVNDVFSFEKELNGEGDEWRNNEACILHKMAGMSKAAALSKVAEGANSDLDQMEILSQLLIETWKGTEEQQHVEDFVVILKRNNASHVRWCTVLNRYHKNIVMDCYIDEM